VPLPSTHTGPYSATASLNEATWFGSAFAQRESVQGGTSCPATQFALGISTDLPHPQSGNEPVGGVTGCVSQCIPAQLLGFHRIPLAVGKYQLADIQSCIEGNTQAACEYRLLIGGDGIINTYYPLGVTIQRGQTLLTIPGTNTSWIEITRYDPATNQLEGRFEVTLKDPANQEARFTNGSFRVTLT
jgi:hypothetical protein